MDKRLSLLINRIRQLIAPTPFKNHIYLTGGCIRNTLLGLPLHDVDIVVDMKDGWMGFATMLALSEKSFVNGTNPIIVNNAAKLRLFGDYDGLQIDCTMTRAGNFKANNFGTVNQDGLGRDFTVNALYYNVTDGKLYEATDGKGSYDFEHKLLRTPIAPEITFKNDPLRILRGIRLACETDFSIEKDTWVGMVLCANEIETVATERIRDEISKILVTQKPSLGIMRMLHCGILENVLPDIYGLQGVIEFAKSNTTWFDHTMKVLDQVQPILEHRLAALFHCTVQIIASEWRTKSSVAYMDNFSADVAASDLKNLKFPKSTITAVETAIKHHRYFSIYADGVLPQDKKLRKFAALCGDHIAATLDLMNARNGSLHYGKKPKQAYVIAKRLQEMEKEAKEKKPQIPINGNDLMKEFNLKKGPHIGVLLNAIKEAFYENPSITKDECFEIAEKRLREIAV